MKSNEMWKPIPNNDYLHETKNHLYIFFVENIIQDLNILDDTIEIIEEQEKIDIQSIEDIKDIYIENASCGEDVKYLAKKYNEILKAVKQLDNK